MVLRNLMEEVHGGQNALGVLAGDIGFPAALAADGEIKGLVALAPQVIQGHILADLHAAANLHAHLPQHIDFRLDDRPVQLVAGDAVGQHAAGLLVLFKDGGLVAHLRQEESAAETCRASAHNGDLLVKAAGLDLGGHNFRDVPGFGVQILLGDELFHLVDGNGLIHGAPGAGILAPAVADPSADRGEGIHTLDEGEGLLVPALSRHFQVALNGNVGGAGGLAGGGAGGIAVDPVLVPVVDVPLVRAPGGVVGELVAGVLHRAGGFAQLLAQLHRAGGADLHAPAAGHAVSCIHLGNVGGAGHVGGVEQLGGPQGVAHLDITVADGEDLLFAVDVRNLVDEAQLLRLFEDGKGLFLGDVPAALLGLHHIVGHVAHGNAPVHGIVAAALPHFGPAQAAGAGRGSVLALVFVQPVGDALDGNGGLLSLNGLFHGDDVHADARPSGGHHGGDLLQGHKGHPLKESGDLRVGLDVLQVHVEELGAARDEPGQEPTLFVVGVGILGL